MDIGKSLKVFAEKMNDTMFGGKPFTYPSTHKMGMIVEEGGSMCANCEYIGLSGKTCKHKQFIAWNAGIDELPVKATRFCCDLWNKQ